MDKASERALLINMVILAEADGAVDALERDYVQQFVKRAGISSKEANAWVAEARRKGLEFQAVPECEPALEMIKLLVGLVAADGQLQAHEASALVKIAKACNISREELLVLLKSCWRRDVISDVLHPTAPEPSARQAVPTVTLVTDNIPELERIVAGEPALAMKEHSLEEVLGGTIESDAIVMHAAEEREDSLQAVRALRKEYPEARIIVIAQRHQAFQIGYLMELGIHRCLVEPLFPNEIVQSLKDDI